MQINAILKKFGLSDKEVKVYLALLESGPLSVRKIAEKTNINRGTAYDILKSLLDFGLVSYYHKEKRQYFTAEDPQKLKEAIKDRQKELVDMKKKVNELIPELRSLFIKSGEKPVVKYYEGYKGVKNILQDLLDVMEKAENKEYFVYSSSNIREYLYKNFSDFSEKRIKKGIKVKVIAIGEGGELQGLDERKWISNKKGTPTYILIYDNKTAFISVDSSDNPLGVIIEDKGIADTQKIIFKNIWNNL